MINFASRNVKGAVMILPVVANYGISNCLIKCGLIFGKAKLNGCRRCAETALWRAAEAESVKRWREERFGGQRTGLIQSNQG